MATAAVEAVGATGVALNDRDPLDVRPALVLACPEGLEWWQRLGIPARIVSDAPGSLWWRVLENTQTATPYSRAPGAGRVRGEGR